jgi:DNA-binding NtrC family response regulator
MKSKPKVLVVEDDEQCVHFYRRILGDEVEILEATTLQAAKDLYAQHGAQIDIFVLDGCVGEKNFNTGGLARFLSETVKRPIIAASSVPEFRTLQMAAGCTHDPSDGKAGVPALIRHILATGFQQ